MRSLHQWVLQALELAKLRVIVDVVSVFVNGLWVLINVIINDRQLISSWQNHIFPNFLRLLSLASPYASDVFFPCFVKDDVVILIRTQLVFKFVGVT